MEQEVVKNPSRGGNPSWVKGMPSPSTGRKSGWQSYKDRAEKYSLLYTSEQLLEIANDKNRLREFSSFDEMIIMNLANALDRKAKNKGFAALERERFLDRFAPPDKPKDDTAAIASAVAAGAVQGLMNALSEKLLGVVPGTQGDVAQGVETATVTLEQKP